MNLPNFLVIGAPKSGSHTLCSHLSQHPEIFVSTPKELDFFNRQYHRGIDWYRQCFCDSSHHTAIGEGSVMYSITSLWPEVPYRIAQDLPHAKLIYIVRHPLDRIESMWCQHLSNGDYIPEFNQAVREWRPLLEGSLYWQQLNQFRQHFPDSQILMVFLEDLIADPHQTVKCCFKFLGVDTNFSIDNAYQSKHTRASLPKDTWLWSILRNTPIGRWARRIFPEDIKGIFRGFLRKKLNKVYPQWNQVTLEWAKDMVESDAQQLLKYAGKDESFWDFSSEMINRKLTLKPQQAKAIKSDKRPFVLTSILDY